MGACRAEGPAVAWQVDLPGDELGAVKVLPFALRSQHAPMRTIGRR
jgi:hypothetical protein